ncbi:amidase family protein [Rhodococcus chondri]|uniref:amidase n=1 Tax=Rhodococcus chondri TaxID=3065941 RepID=A0ABU7JUB3_9NOCA|nr:amidase family protein [Rhodococcus sp. CC-R104]MEE2033621.1 amidase family protein [Rhodococcus sp. CC-R104]
MDLDEYARYDGLGLRELIATGQVAATEIEEAARHALEVANAEVNGLALPLFRPALDHVDWEDAVHSSVGELVAAVAPLLGAPRQPDPTQMEAVSRQILEKAVTFSALDLMAALNAQNRVTRSVGAFFTGYDLLVTPALGRLPAPHGTLQYDNPDHTVMSWLRSLFDYGPFTSVFNISGQPAISLPLGQSENGLPIGVQLVAPYGREDILFRIAATLEQVLPWRDRTPPNFVGTS